MFFAMRKDNIDEISLDKPYESLQKIHNFIKVSGESFSIPQDSILVQEKSKSEQKIWLISNGTFTVMRKTDELQILTSKAPSIFGLGDAYYYRGHHYMLANTACEGYCIPCDVFMSLVHEKGLERDVAVILAYIIQVIMHRDENIFGVDSYTAIRSSINELINYPLEMRMDITVQKFIQNRTNMSRSNIFKMLSELRAGGYIVMENGKLISVKHLPLAF